MRLHSSLSKALIFLVSFTYNEMGIGESVEMRHLARGHWVANAIFALAFFWVPCRALASVAFFSMLMGRERRPLEHYYKSCYYQFLFTSASSMNTDTFPSSHSQSLAVLEWV